MRSRSDRRSYCERIPAPAKARELFEAVRRCDDQLGRYSDHEGSSDDGAPTAYMWAQGYAKFKRRCYQSIEDHLDAVEVWRRLAAENERRKPKERVR